MALFLVLLVFVLSPVALSLAEAVVCVWTTPWLNLLSTLLTESVTVTRTNTSKGPRFDLGLERNLILPINLHCTALFCTVLVLVLPLEDLS